MTLRYADTVAEAVIAPSGSAAFTVSSSSAWGAVAGLGLGYYLSFAGIPNITTGDTVFYNASDGSGNKETGLGTYSASAHTLTRTQVFSSTNGNSTVLTFSGTVILFCVVPAAYFMPATVAAAGTTQGTASTLSNRINFITSGTGGVIPSFPLTMKLINRSGAGISVYPMLGGQIESYGVNNAAPALANGADVTLEPISATEWYLTA
jgi:hypothetical protein